MGIVRLRSLMAGPFPLTVPAAASAGLLDMLRVP